MKVLDYDVAIAGCGVAGLYAALNLPREKNILIISKTDVHSSGSMLAQGGICVLRDADDYEDFFADTLRAGHYENHWENVEIMIKSSRAVIDNLLKLGVRFAKNDDGSLKYTREGAHSRPRICFHKDITGKEITSALLKYVQSLSNITVLEYTVMTDIIEDAGTCTGMKITGSNGEEMLVRAAFVIMATGGIGGLYEHSTNFPHLTGDGCRIAGKHGVKLEHMDYVQIHPTSLYTEKPGRSFLISESARGENAILLNNRRRRFIDELLPRDVVAKAIYNEMKREGTKHVWMSFENVSKQVIRSHFPNIYEKCLEEGYDILKEMIPIVPAQHYFMGGIHVDSNSESTMKNLFAIGETSCNGVHGKNRLASNSLLESLVFAARAAKEIAERSI